MNLSLTTLTTFAKAACGALFALCLVFPATSRADVYIQTSDRCGGIGCGVDASNTVTISQTAAQLLAGTVEVKVSLDSPYFFVSTGAGDMTFGFSSSLSGLALAILPATSSAGNWSIATVQTSGLQMDGVKFPATGYGADWGSSGGGNHDGGLLDLTVTKAGLTVSSFIASLQAGNIGSSLTNLFFAADVIAPDGQTGIIAFSAGPNGTSPVPVPALGAGLPGLIAACMGLVVFARRRRNRFA
jgi:hypothetical protein